MLKMLPIHVDRYGVRTKAGKEQSSEDVGVKIAHSAGASIRRHNELALNKLRYMTGLLNYCSFLCCQFTFSLFLMFYRTPHSSPSIFRAN
ncbi:hypothetical protein Hanom_Chr16g01467251 [Helianthus anomalus]